MNQTNNRHTINCPECGAAIPLDQALSHRLREELSAEFTQRLASEKRKLAEAAAAEARQNLSVELTDLRSQLQEQQLKRREAEAAELEVRRQKCQLEHDRQTLELRVARELEGERQKIAEAARLQAVESERLKLADKENIIKVLQEQITALKQRAEQSSVQAQGETLEIALEDELRKHFPTDEVSPIKNGERGADIVHRVFINGTLDCGTILWEAKRAKNWSAHWISKLKEDQRASRSELAVLTTTCPPPGLRGLGQLDGVWVCEPLFACALAAALRQGLVSAAVQRSQDNGRSDKMSQVYEFVCGVEFRQHVEGLVESFIALEEQLAAEKRAFDRQWKEREQRLRNALQHTAMLYGSIQGIAGRSALPQIQTLELTDGNNVQ